SDVDHDLGLVERKAPTAEEHRAPGDRLPQVTEAPGLVPGRCTGEPAAGRPPEFGDAGRGHREAMRAAGLAGDELPRQAGIDRLDERGDLRDHPTDVP